MLDTSIGVSSCRLEGGPEQSVRSEDIDFIWSSNIHVLTREGPSVFTFRTFELSAEGKIRNTGLFSVCKKTKHLFEVYTLSFTVC